MTKNTKEFVRTVNELFFLKKQWIQHFLSYPGSSNTGLNSSWRQKLSDFLFIGHFFFFNFSHLAQGSLHKRPSINTGWTSKLIKFSFKLLGQFWIMRSNRTWTQGHSVSDPSKRSQKFAERKRQACLKSLNEKWTVSWAPFAKRSPAVP